MILISHLKPSRGSYETPKLVLSPDYSLDRVSQIYVHDDRPTRLTSFWTHLTLERQSDLYRLSVTTELLPCAPRSPNTKQYRWTAQKNEGQFKLYVRNVRYSDSPRLLAEISDVVDAALLGRVRTDQPPGRVHATYADTGFHFVPSDDGALCTSAYREFPTNFGIRDPVALINSIANHPLALERMTATITLRDE